MSNDHRLCRRRRHRPGVEPTINLTEYPASVMVIAIAIVVTILDNVSARIRSRII
ncbi:MAG: hypothetical protein H6669_10900 [Ardenticatenaceae bacterium]|nr:hypothetical protein [Ardenticatenaceae bacterium]